MSQQRNSDRHVHFAPDRLPEERRVHIPVQAAHIAAIAPSVARQIHSALSATSSPPVIHAALKTMLEQSGCMEDIRSYVYDLIRQIDEQHDENGLGPFPSSGIAFNNDIIAKVLEEVRKGLPPAIVNLKDTPQTALAPTSRIKVSETDLAGPHKVVREELWKSLDFIGVDSGK